MFHKASEIEFKKGTTVQVKYQDGVTKEYDMANLFSKYPQLKALKNRKLFTSGKLLGPYGIIWNEDLDIDAETIYEDGITVKTEKPLNMIAADAVRAARANANMSQAELSALCGIDQSDISKIERGLANPSIAILTRIADALDSDLLINFKQRKE